jgi:GT2 family glycosyltransferase
MKILTSTIAVLITCHNRKEKTLRCLHALFSQKGIGEYYLIEVFLVDDGCTDGTSEAIIYDFPEINIIQGNGELYWNRGMHLAWETAVKTKDFDYFLWLNDDTFLHEFAFEVLFKEIFKDTIICGTTQSKLDLTVTYGAYTKNSSKLIIPNGKYQHSDYCNGNCVIIPKSVYSRLGNLDPFFEHALGDLDYSMRAVKAGIELKVAPEFVGYCERHDTIPEWQSISLNVFERLENLYSPLSGCNPPEFFVFEKRYNGIFLAIKHIISVHLRCLFPRLFNWYQYLINKL